MSSPLPSSSSSLSGSSTIITPLSGSKEVLGDLTTKLSDRLMLHIFSYLNYGQLLFARLVCLRWCKTGENMSLYKSISMQDFMLYSRILPMQTVRSYIYNLGINQEELNALKVCCREMPVYKGEDGGPYITLATSRKSFSGSSDSKTPSKDEEARKERARNDKDKKVMDLKKIWVEEILPNWNKEGKKPTQKRLQELCMQGIPSPLRPKIWPLLVGNELRITQELFSILLSRANRAKKQSEGQSLGREGSVQLIHLDLPRTFPMLSIFQKGGPYHQFLANVLEAYACYRPDVGYVQGMSYVAAICLLNMNEYEAFVTLANLLNNPCYMSFFQMNMTEIAKYMKVMDGVLKESLPKLHKHLSSLSIAPDIYLIDWVLTLFSKALPLDVAARVWDVLFLQGEIFVFHTAVGVLKLYSGTLESSNFDEAMTFLTHLPNDIDENDLFEAISSVSINPRTFQKLLSNPG